MLENVKILLTINLEGGTLVRQEEAEEFVTKVKLFKDGKPLYKNKKVKHFPLKARPSKQVIRMSKEAYKYMTSTEAPSWFNPKKWAILEKNQRLELHLARVAHDLKGISFKYEILED